MNERQPDPLLPIGAQVVTRVELRDAAGAVLRPRGAVGVIAEAPADVRDAYRVRFADGGEALLHRSALRIRKDYQRAALDELLIRVRLAGR